MGTLVSVNVGMPKNVPWRGKTVYTGIWKTPVEGPVMVRRLNIDGDGQGDLAGHGGEQRAVMVYQTESYDFWKAFLNRDDLMPGHFGENFTVTGLSRRRSLHRRPLPDRRRRIRGHPAARHLLPGRPCASTNLKCPICLSPSIVRASTSASSPRARSRPVTTSCGPGVAVTNSASPTSTHCSICPTATSNNSARSSTYPR